MTYIVLNSIALAQTLNKQSMETSHGHLMILNFGRDKIETYLADKWGV